MTDSLRRAVLLLIGAVGTLVFALALALTFSRPQWVEDYAAEFIAKEVARRVDQQIDRVGTTQLTGALGRAVAEMQRRNQAKIDGLKGRLRARVHDRLAAAITGIRDPNCECRRRWSRWLEEGDRSQLLLLSRAQAGLTEFIQRSYAATVAELTRDLRVFTAANAAMFALVLVVALAKPRASRQLFVPALLLATSALVCAWFYLFEQNWLLTVVYDDYLGLAYLAWLALVFALLCDIVLNRARVTTRILNFVLNAVGSVAQATPC